MTLSDLQAKRDEIVKTIGIIQMQYGERSVQYQDQAKALALIDSEIAKATVAATGATSRCTYAQTSKGTL